LIQFIFEIIYSFFRQWNVSEFPEWICRVSWNCESREQSSAARFSSWTRGGTRFFQVSWEETSYQWSHRSKYTALGMGLATSEGVVISESELS